MAIEQTQKGEPSESHDTPGPQLSETARTSAAGFRSWAGGDTSSFCGDGCADTLQKLKFNSALFIARQNFRHQFVVGNGKPADSLILLCSTDSRVICRQASHRITMGTRF